MDVIEDLDLSRSNDSLKPITYQLALMINRTSFHLHKLFQLPHV